MSITVFNRREVYMGFSAAEYDRVKCVLSDAGIAFRTQLSNRASPFLGRNPVVWTTLSTSYFYYVYVYKDDYEIVFSLIR